MGERPENTLRELLEEGFVSQERFINIRPKQRCPCGSKKKFKKCCGRLLEDK
nr:SEC-C metal-binding domain-containing protein [Lentimonas sp. CC6]